MSIYEEILNELFNNKNKVKLGLDRVKDVLNKLNKPHLAIKTIHVAGTNGKGSTSSMIASILQDAGFKVGLFISPFVIDFRESIQINKNYIKKEEIVRLYNKVKNVDENNLTYFEIKTIMAFLYFFKNNVDFAIIETGLGGRLDATNVIKPLVSIITNISLEHKDYLGETIEKIAYEKAGIIKEDTPIITLSENAGLNTIKQIAKKKNSELITVNVNEPIFTNLNGNFQQKNVYLAKEAIDYLRKKYHFEISEDNIYEGLLQVKIPGRFQRFDNVIYDCAHNPNAMKTLKNEIQSLPTNKVISIITIMDDKNKLDMINEIDEFSDYIIFTRVNIKRCSDPYKLRELSFKENEIIINPKEALKKAQSLSKEGDLVIVTGSCYLIGELIPR